MKEEYENDKYNFLPSENQKLHPTFQVDGIRFTYEQYDIKKPGLFKAETIKDKWFHCVVKCIVHQILQKKN
jgi:hypothetical protein